MQGLLTPSPYQTQNKTILSPGTRSKLSKHKMLPKQKPAIFPLNAPKIIKLVDSKTTTYKTPDWEDTTLNVGDSTGRITEFRLCPQNSEYLKILRIINPKNPLPFDTSLPVTDLSLHLSDCWTEYQGQGLQGDRIQESIRHGYGILRLANGQEFRGWFVQDAAEGKGTYYRRDSSVLVGIWRSNKLMHGSTIALDLTNK